MDNLFAITSSSSHRQCRTEIDAMRQHLDCTTLLSQLNIQTNAEIDNHSSLTISAANYNNSSIPIETDHPFYLFHSHTPLIGFSNDQKSKEQRKSSNNSSRKSRNMITVRRVPCYDTPDRHRTGFEDKNRKNRSESELKRYKKRRSTTPVESKPPLLSSEGRRELSTTSFSNHFILHNDVKKKMANSPVPSLLSTHLPTTVSNSTKPDVTEDICTMPEDSPNDFQSFDDHQPRRSTASSPRTPHVPDHISSLTIPRSNLSKPESRPISNSLERNTQELIDQMKTLIETLRLLLENKIDIRSYADRKKIKKKTKQSSSDRTKNNPFSEYMTITKCNFPTDHSRKNWQGQLPIPDNDRPNELQRCLLVHCRNRSERIDINERQRHLHRTWNHATSREHITLSASSQSLSDNEKNMLTVSKSTLILAEEDDEEHQSFDRFCGVLSF